MRSGGCKRLGSLRTGVLSCALFVCACPSDGAAQTSAAATLQGLSLEQAIAVLEERGLTVFYSSDLVKPDMSVAEQPQTDDPRAQLEAILAPFGLALEPGPAGSVLIVRAAGTARSLHRYPGAPSREPGTAPGARPALEEIVVAASQYELSRAAGSSLTTLTSLDIEYSPDLGDDALRAVHRLPGAATNGFSARANVRGGEVGETLVRFDKLRLYNPFHLKDFQSVFSTVDPRVIGSMDVYTGGFPAAFGDRMSSVIDVASLPAPEHRYQELAMSFFNTSALTSGRFGDGDGEWLASVRRSNLDLLYGVFSEQPGRPRYVDAFAKLSYKLGDRFRLTGNVLYVEDDISLSDDVDLEEQAHANDEDRYVWLRLDGTLRGDLRGSTLVAHSSFVDDRTGITTKVGISSGELRDLRSFDIGSVQSDWSFPAGEKLLVQFGATASSLRGEYDYSDEVEFDLLVDTPGAPTETSRSRQFHVAPRGNQYALYGSLRYRPTARVTADFGLRWDKQTLDPAHTDTFGPRIGVRFQLADRTYLRGSLGRFYQSQSIDELQVEDGVQRFFAPQRSDHAVIGLEHDFPSGINLRLEAYSKEMRDLRPRYENLLNPLTLLPELKPDRIEIAPDAAHARGMEVLLNQRLRPELSWWTSYTYSWVKDEIGADWVYRGWDQTRALSAGLNWDSPKWNIGFGLIHRSGWPTTAVTLDTSGATPILRAAPRNSSRVGFFRSADLRLTRKVHLDRGSLSAFLELNNAFGRRNPCCTEFQVETGDDEQPPGPEDLPTLDLTWIDYLPLVPSLGFVWSF